MCVLQAGPNYLSMSVFSSCVIRFLKVWVLCKSVFFCSHDVQYPAGKFDVGLHLFHGAGTKETQSTRRHIEYSQVHRENMVKEVRW